MLGHNVLHCLMEEKHRAVILVRRADAMRIEGDYEVRTGSLLDYPTLLAAAEGCDACVDASRSGGDGAVGRNGPGRKRPQKSRRRESGDTELLVIMGPTRTLKSGT